MLADKLLKPPQTTPTYIEDVFSTYLYTGTGAAQTITNNIDLSTKGGLVWIKNRTGGSGDHSLYDSARGLTSWLATDTTGAQSTFQAAMNSFNTTGFSLKAGNAGGNDSTMTYASWTFRKQPKFFTCGTYTGNGTTQNITHDLGSAPGCVIVKSTTSGTEHWNVWHRGAGTSYYLFLDATDARTNLNSANRFGNNSTAVAPTSTYFTVGSESGVNLNGGSYVYYAFAHDAGGFGLTGTDNVISCGSYTGNGSTTGPVVTLGYEPQWLLIKRTDTTSNWSLMDNMRGLTAKGGDDFVLFPNTSGVETYYSDGLAINATGFQLTSTNAPINASGGTYIYIAIRRGPMKVPTDGTTVFSPNASSAATGTQITTNFPVDMQMWNIRTGDGNNSSVSSRLQGVSSTTTESAQRMITSSTGAEITTGSVGRYWNNTGFQMPSYIELGSNIFWNFRRAPSFFDEVCYTGTGVAGSVTHNLGVAPELMIVKQRSGSGGIWCVYQKDTGASSLGQLQSTAAFINPASQWNSTAPTSSVFSLGSTSSNNDAGATYVAYLFATCAGVSKVGSFTGNGSTQTINCGFAGGARFVLIKRTDSTGDWYVYDTARGMTTLTDPYLLLNSTAAESVTLGSVTTVTTGFAVNASILAAINTNGASYVFLAVA